MGLITDPFFLRIFLGRFVYNLKSNKSTKRRRGYGIGEKSDNLSKPRKALYRLISPHINLVHISFSVKLCFCGLS